MIYLDTSFIAPLVIEESSSDAVEALVMKVKAGELATSTWAQVELASLVARRLRMGDISAADADAVRLELDRLFKESFEVLVPTRVDYSTAAAFLEAPKTSLRAGDALHLAIAASHRAARLLTLDQGFIRAGKQLKLPVSAGIK